MLRGNGLFGSERTPFTIFSNSGQVVGAKLLLHTGSIDIKSVGRIAWKPSAEPLNVALVLPLNLAIRFVILILYQVAWTSRPFKKLRPKKFVGANSNPSAQ